jgi:hypothetical protein
MDPVRGWVPVTRQAPKIDPASPRERAFFSCKLSVDPPDEWVDFFMNPQVETEFPPDNLRIERSHGLPGFEIVGECAETYLEKCVTNIDARIQNANTKYEQEIIPRMTEDNKRTVEQERAQSQRIDDLQRRADRL